MTAPQAKPRARAGERYEFARLKLAGYSHGDLFPARSLKGDDSIGLGLAPRLGFDQAPALVQSRNAADPVCRGDEP